MRTFSLTAIAVAASLAAGCGERARLPDAQLVGPRPTITTPERTLLPTVNIAPAAGWPLGAAPQAAAGLQARPLAMALQHPRWLLVLPGGDVLVAESNAPPRPEDGKGVRGWVMKKVMGRAGAGVPSPDRITLLRDADADGEIELRTTFAEKLHSPFGMAVVGDRIYVAEADGVREWPYRPGMTRLEGEGRRLAELPGGPINHHWTKNIIGSPDGRQLYATVGSNSNVAENGLAVEEGRAAIWQIDRASGAKRQFASGLRNPNGMAFTPDGRLWTVVNERDELGSDLVPDYLTSVREGGFYGWPFAYWGTHVDERVEPPRPDLVQRALVPDYALGTHVAPLGLAAAGDGPVVAALAGAAASASAAAASVQASASGVRGMFVGLHGSWNRRPLSGYKVVFVPFVNNQPNGEPLDVLTGFVDGEGRARGRPVGVALDASGALLVADDVGNTVWRVAPPR